MGLYYFRQTISPEQIFEVTGRLPPDVNVGEVNVRLEPQGIATVVVEETSIKKATKKGRVLVEERLKEGGGGK
jgi:hypothetical protein